MDDCRLLGSLLDDCLRIEVGDELFHKVRRGGVPGLIRVLAAGHLALECRELAGRAARG